MNEELKNPAMNVDENAEKPEQDGESSGEGEEIDENAAAPEIAQVVVEIPKVKIDPSGDGAHEDFAGRRSCEPSIRSILGSPTSFSVSDWNSESDIIFLDHKAPPRRKRGRPPKNRSLEEEHYDIKTREQIAELQKLPYVQRLKRYSKGLAASTRRTQNLPPAPSFHSDDALGIYEQIERHIRKAEISCSYTLNLEKDSIVNRVTEILRGQHSSYDVVTALVRLGVLCVDNPILPPRGQQLTDDSLMKNLIQQLQTPGTSSSHDVLETEFDDIQVLDSDIHSEVNSLSGDVEAEKAMSSLLKSFPAKRGKYTYAALNEAVWKFFIGCQSANVQLNGKILRSRAISIAKRMGLEYFRSSESWLNGFKYRHKIDFAHMTGIPFDYSKGLEPDYDSAQGSGHGEPTVREVVTSASNLNIPAKSLIFPTADEPIEAVDEGSPISASQFVQSFSHMSQVPPEAPVPASASTPIDNGTVDNGTIPADEEEIATKTVDTPVDASVIESIVKSCVFALPDTRVQAAVDTLRSYILTSNSLNLLKPLSEIQETLARSMSPNGSVTAAPAKRRRDDDRPMTIPSFSGSQVTERVIQLSKTTHQLAAQSPGESRMVYRKSHPRTHIKYASGRPPGTVQFPKMHYQPYQHNPPSAQ
ncbi:hypothetical protein L596_023770 [Steinernema carpocapsae]|nr:hypothetical protein L596_023770 [Steinernema carpocapsae]